MTHRLFTLVSCAALLGCAMPQAAPPDPASDLITLGAIETSADGVCFARNAAETRTVTEDVLIEVVPAVKDRNGVVTSPAVFRNVTRPQTIVTGEGARFETVCPPLLSEAFVTTLQRALRTRDAYSGDLNGHYDTATGLAVQRFQRDQGFDSPYLAVATARQLGILAVARDGS